MTSIGIGLLPPPSGAVHCLSLAPGFSRVLAGDDGESRFNGLGFVSPFGVRREKPLKRLLLRRPLFTGLKPGANESGSVTRRHLRGAQARWLGLALTAWLTFLPFVGAAADVPAFGFQTNDVIAFVGGEDVVEMQRNGYLELLLTTALPHHKLRFRNLAFEGDTVFEQHRQLNFPSWEKQLERVGATVVIAQFGQAESLRGTNGLTQFVAAYAKLLDRFTDGDRRMILLSPTPFRQLEGGLFDLTSRNKDLRAHVEATRVLAKERRASFIDLFSITRRVRTADKPGALMTRDGQHLSWLGHALAADTTASSLIDGRRWERGWFDLQTGIARGANLEHLRQLILEKNRLWFDYWRPQNWAFLAGDRTEQPSSRDHRDPKKRWFPEEMEKFLPLIEAKEKEIWKLASELK